VAFKLSTTGLILEFKTLDINDPESLGAQATISTLGPGSLKVWLQIYRQAAYSNAGTLLPQGLYVKVGEFLR